MRKELLMGAAGLALLLGASGAAWAEGGFELDIEVDFVVSKNSAVAYDTQYSNIEQGDGTVAQDNSQAGNSQGPLLQSHEDAIWGGQNATDNGAIADQGNALGEDVRKNAVASDNSEATWVNARNAEAAAINDSTAVENGALVGGNGVALGENNDGNAAIGGDGIAIATDGYAASSEGSAVQLGEGNTAAAASYDSASVVGDGTAIANDGYSLAQDGSSFTVGDNNRTATAYDDSAAVNGDDGFAIATDGYGLAHEGSNFVLGEDNTAAAAEDGSAVVVGSGTAIATDGGELADNGSNFILGDNNTSAAAEESAVVGRDGTALYVHGDAKLKGNATGLFGANNVVAHSTLEQEVSHVHIAGYLEIENSNYPELISTGRISGNTVEMTGVNLTALNTGIVNQGRSISVSVTAAF